MIQRSKPSTRIVLGVWALAFATVAFQWLHYDFLGGLAFGIGAPLMFLGLSEKQRK